MPLESATYIDELVSTNPAASDGLAQADDHLRLIKAVLLASFPNISGAADVTDVQLADLADGIVKFAAGGSTTPSMRFSAEETLGFYRASAANAEFVGGRLSGDGLIPAGAVVDFLVEPSGFKNDGTSGGKWLELNGEEYEDADYPALAAHLAQVGSTFTLPDCTTTGRFRRSRQSGTAAGDTQANAIKTHTHDVTGTAASGGAHTHTGTTASNGAHTHVTDVGHGGTAQSGAGVSAGSHNTSENNNLPTDSQGAHTHTFTTDSGGAHSHDVTGTAAAHSGAASETRPEALVVITCIKT
jgi:hypothetical protein